MPFQDAVPTPAGGWRRSRAERPARLVLDLHFTPVLAELICAAVDLDVPALDLAGTDPVSRTVRLRPRRRGFAEEVLRASRSSPFDAEHQHLRVVRLTRQHATVSMMREFDLNIERVLETGQWRTRCALPGGGRTVWRILWTWPTSGLPSTRTG